MKIAVFTSNQPRHLALLNAMAEVADEVIAVQECNTVFPGRVADFFRRSPVMQAYFQKVIEAERSVFGDIGFARNNVRQLPVRMGDLNMIDPALLAPALDADTIIVFGASWIKAPLIDRLTEKRAINIHMGISPFYRGSSCNFWALYDDNPQFVGATIHMLSRGLDSGQMLFHALPKPEAVEPFRLGMLAVRAAHLALKDALADGSLWKMPLVQQDKAVEIRYTRNADFTDAVAEEYLARGRDAAWVGSMLAKAEKPELLAPRFL
ncbi:formyltransferase family protein [Dongia sedimenti]|uniref:Formyltransferase family protein n=1 Tax=Dongia sedimenti TaxID=3064282 RepID=A0ABU0YM58_9PROT|nr:formyltransferase family protein [Rhodospirillaceae bacterium R-7]